jgi:membrane associated rhomboid family serine protease
MKHRDRTLLPVVTLALTVAILVVFAVELVGDGQALCAAYGLIPTRPTFGTALSSLFLHDPTSWAHVIGNLVVLLVVGARVEQAIGALRFAALYIAGGLAGAALHIIVDPSSLSPLVGCSGALFAVLAFAAVLYGPAMLGFVAMLVATNVAHAFGLGAPADAAVSFGAHIGGFTLGAFLVVLARFRGFDVRLRAARTVAA